MISMYRWQQLKAMRARGESIKGIARRLGLSKNTVRKYLRSSGAPELKRREYERVLDSYGRVMTEMLGKGYIGTRIYTELLGMGYRGSLSTVHRYIAESRQEEKIRSNVTTRVETLPGKQMQYDWTEWLLPVNGRPLKVYIHEVILSFSRKKYWNYSLSITTQDVIRAIATGIDFLGGVAEELVIDNPKQMVITHRRDGMVRYNDEFLRFCGLYEIEPNPCQNYRARTKGKVERPFYYICEHLLKGLEVRGLGEFDSLLKDFTCRYNGRVHSTLKQSPQEMFLKESAHLRKIPAVEPQFLYQRQPRKVTNDGYIPWSGSFYPVPMRLCLREVMVEVVLGRFLRIYESSGQLVKECEITVFQKGIRPQHPEHESINQLCTEKKKKQRSAIVEKFVSMFGATGEEYIDGLRKTQWLNFYWHLSEILACCQLYNPQQVSQSLKDCIHIGTYHKDSVLRLLSCVKLKSPCLDGAVFYAGLPRGEIARPLSVYAGIVEVPHE